MRTEFGGKVVVGALTRCALLHSVCDFQVTQMNVQRSLIRELTLYKFELSHDAVEATEKICYTKG